MGAGNSSGTVLSSRAPSPAAPLFAGRARRPLALSLLRKAIVTPASRPPLGTPGSPRLAKISTLPSLARSPLAILLPFLPLPGFVYLFLIFFLSPRDNPGPICFLVCFFFNFVIDFVFKDLSRPRSWIEKCAIELNWVHAFFENARKKRKTKGRLACGGGADDVFFSIKKIEF